MKNVTTKILGLIAIIAALSVQTTNATLFVVNGNAGPWQYSGTLNTSFAYGVHDQAAPTIVSGLVAGNGVTLSYVSGLVSWAPIPSAAHDANGSLANPNFADPSNPNGAGPGYFTANPNATYLGQLIGAFTDSTGQLVGIPFAVGNGPIGFTVPVGATRLQLGVNDNAFGDNSGSWSINVQVVPEPGAFALAGLGAMILGWRRRHAVRR